MRTLIATAQQHDGNPRNRRASRCSQLNCRSTPLEIPPVRGVRVAFYGANRLLPAVLDTWRRMYRGPDRHRSLYAMGERLIDLEDHFRRWRFNDVSTVERIMRLKKGAGGWRFLFAPHAGSGSVSRSMECKVRALKRRRDRQAAHLEHCRGIWVWGLSPTGALSASA